MEQQVLVSVLIPNYNRGELMVETLESIIAQTYPNWEAIVVDDGSTDKSDDVGANYAVKDSRIKYFKRDRMPNGAPTCRNLAFQKSKGEYIIFLDSDDLLAPHCLEQRVVTASTNTGYDFWVFPMLLFKSKITKARNLWNKSDERSALIRFLMLDAVWQTSGPLWIRSAVEKTGGFTEGLACWQDVDFHLNALSSGMRYFMAENLPPDVFYRQHESGSISQGEINTPPKMASRQKIFYTYADRLLPDISAEIKNGLKILGSSVVIGAIKAFNHKVANETLSFGMQKGVFDNRFRLKMRLMKLLHTSRLYRLPLFKQFTRYLIQHGKTPSSIGKITYYP